MSRHIWTADALRSEETAYSGIAWRFVEAQHQVSTLKLTDSLAEQETLEHILETTKPPIPPECWHYHFLLATPFRYRPYPRGSRFRRAGVTQGVWYGSEEPETAAAEMVFYRFLFYAESPETPFPDGAAEYTAFSAELATAAALDLTAGRLGADREIWTHLTDYAPCQDLADSAREIGIEVLRYQSVRAKAGGPNLAVLTCRAFSTPQPIERQTWRIRISRTGAQALREHPRLGLEFSRSAFEADPRLDGMDWDRPARK